jgi:YHS domain-containing protein
MLAAATLAALLAPTEPASAKQAPVYTGIVKGVAVGGYDPVAYFTQGKPVKGEAGITLDHMGATWRFASEANRAAFQADPARYAPQYGGYCAWAVSQGYTAKGDPSAWTIAGGKLYLNYDQAVKRGWEKDIPGNVAKGDANWPKVLAK